MAQVTRPGSLDEALTILASHPAIMPLAGGTDVFPAMAHRHAWFLPQPEHLLDLTGIGDLRGITQSDRGWRIGALTTWTELAEAALPPCFDGLKLACVEVGGRQIQNRGTIGGNLCNASPAADGVPPLLALNAEVELQSHRGVRRLPLAHFTLGNRRTALNPDELLTAVIIPDAVPHLRSTFLKLGARAALIISIASVAASASYDEAGRIIEIRIAVGACGPVPIRLNALEHRLRGERLSAHHILDADIAALTPIDDVRATAAYRLHAARTLITRALEQLDPLTRRAA